MELQRAFHGRKAILSASGSLLLLFHLATTSHGLSLPRASCPKTCVPLRKCPRLSNLLSNLTTENVNTLKAATCRVENMELLVCCPQSLLPLDCGQPVNYHNTLGGEATIFDSDPWMAALGYKDHGVSGVVFLCGGSVINERYILTAAHCVDPSSIGHRRLEVVRLGEWDLTTEVDCVRFKSGQQSIRYCAPPAQNYDVESTVVHYQYNTRAIFSDDIALIRVSRKIDLSHRWIYPVCLPPSNFDVRRIPATPEPIVSGWGLTENGAPNPRIHKVSVPFVDNQQCNITYGGNMVNEQMCLGGQRGQDSCNGDSGGPLVMTGPQGPPFLQIGVVSYGPINCGQTNVPEVYTSVSHYRNWIEQIMRP